MAYMPLITPSTTLMNLNNLDSLEKNSNKASPQTKNQPTGNEQQASSSIDPYSNYETIYQTSQSTVDDLQASSSLYSFSNYETPYQTDQHVATASNQPTGNEQQVSATVTDTRKRTYSDTFSLRIELTKDDPTFKMSIDTFFQLMPQADVKRMDQALNNHGKKASGERITVLEHVKEVFLGQFGGFGLSTDVLGASEKQQKICRAALRIAAFLHDIGKIEGQKNHFATHKADTIRIATEQLTNEYAAYGLDSATACLAIALIRHRNFIGDFTRPNPKKSRSLEAIQTELQQAYQGLPNTAVTFEMFCQMLLKLYVANASTLSKVQKVGRIYKQFLIDNQEFKFRLLVVFKEKLLKALPTKKRPQQKVTQTQTQFPMPQQPPQQQFQAMQFQNHAIQIPMPLLTPQQQFQAPQDPIQQLQQQFRQPQQILQNPVSPAFLSERTSGDSPKNLEETQEKTSRAKKKQRTKKS